MATTTIVITDTPDGRINVISDYKPERGARCSLAQQATLEILTRTRREYGLDRKAEAAATPTEPTPGENPMPNCPKCGDNAQVWANQITKVLTCHRAFCDTQIFPVSHHPV